MKIGCILDVSEDGKVATLTATSKHYNLVIAVFQVNGPLLRSVEETLQNNDSRSNFIAYGLPDHQTINMETGELINRKDH